MSFSFAWSALRAAMSRAASLRVERRASRASAALFDTLEPRVLFSAAFDLIHLTEMRADPDFADIDGTGVSVAVIDTGVDFSHTLLAPNFVAGADIVFGGSTPTPTADHGTHVAGIVGATDPEIGVAPDVGLIGLQVFTPVPGREPSAFNRHIEAALQWVLAHRVEFNIVAVNMSLGGGFYESEAQAGTPIYLDEIRALEDSGVTVVSAAGNSYGILQDPTSGQTFNAMFPNSGAPGIFSTLDVGAVWDENEGSDLILGNAIDLTTDGDHITGFSQRPPTNVGNAIFAPGAFINSTIPGNRFAEYPGTSMASPMVAGAVALLQEAALKFGGRLLSPGEVRDILISTGDPIFDGDDENSLAFVDANGDNVISNSELVPFNYTDTTYSRLNVYDAVREVRARFENIAPSQGAPGTGDANGTIAGAYIGPRLDGSPASGLRARIGFDQQAIIGGSDVDMYRFDVLSPGTVTLEVGSDTVSPQDFDTVLRLFDSQGTQLAINDDIQPGGNTFSRITIDLQPGTYYVGVSGFGNASYNPLVAGSGQSGANGSYRIDFTLNNDDPNGLISGAVAVNLGGGGEPEFFAGFIGADYGQPVGVADVDLFRVVIPDDGVLLVDTDTPFSSGEFVDSFLRVFDANGNELAVSDDDLAIDIDGNPTEFTDPLFSTLVFEDPVDRQFFDGHTTDSFLAVAVSRGDVFYIGVSDFFNSQYNPTNLSNRPAIGTGGNYNLTLAFYNNDLNGSIPQAVDTSGVTLPIIDQPGAIGTDGISGGGSQVVGDRDVDFVRITPVSDGILEVDIDSYSVFDASEAVDTVLYIFDAQGNYLAGNDDNDGLDPLVRLEVQGGVDYFVAVVGFGNENFDPFQLGSGSPGDTGEYRFSARLLSSDTLIELANNGTDFSGVAELQDGDTISEFLGSDNGLVIGPGDVDFFRFTAAADAMIDVSTRQLSDFSADTFLRVFNAQGAEIAFNDNAGPTTLASEVMFAALAGQTYSIGVSSAGASARSYDPATGDGAPTDSEGSYTLTLNVLVEPTPEIDVQGGGVTVVDGDDTPTSADDTDFGTVTIGAAGVTHTFTIANLGDASLNLTGNPLVSISGDTATLADFMITQPAGAAIAPSGSVTFDVTFMPIGASGGVRTATISIASDDDDENPYTFDITGMSVAEAVPDVKVTGLGQNIVSGDDTPSATDGTLFDATIIGQQLVHDFILTNVGTANLSFENLRVVDMQGQPSDQFTVVAVGGEVLSETILRVTFAPTSGGEHLATVTFDNNDPDENPFSFDVSGVGVDRTLVATFGQSLGLTKLVRDDNAGNTFEFSLTGAGSAMLYQEASGRLSLELTGTDDRSRLTIKAKTATDAAIDTITGDGPLAALGAKGIAILGDVLFAGRVGSTTLGNVDSQHTLALGGAATDKPINVSLGVLTDVTFTSTAPVQRFAAVSIVDSDDMIDIITAPRIGTLQVKGDKETVGRLESNVTITGESVDRRSIDTLLVTGPVSDVTIDITGEAGSVTFKDAVSNVTLNVMGPAGTVDMRGSVDDLMLTIDGALRSLRLGDVSTADVTAGSTGSVSAVRWLDGNLALVDAKSIRTTGDRKTITPGDFGPDVTLNADSDSLARQALGSARIADTLTGQWLIVGPVGTIAAGAVADAFTAQVNGEVKSLSSKAHFDGIAAAFAFGSINIKGSTTGATILAGSPSEDLSFTSNFIKSLKIGGDVTGNTRVLVGVDGFDAAGPFKVGVDHFIKSMRITGDAAGDSAFQAGAFPKSVSINKVKVDPTTDDRFTVSA